MDQFNLIAGTKSKTFTQVKEQNNHHHKIKKESYKKIKKNKKESYTSRFL